MLIYLELVVSDLVVSDVGTFMFFSYNKMTNSGELKTLKNTSFPISSYSLIALVGAPGSGKTYQMLRI